MGSAITSTGVQLVLRMHRMHGHSLLMIEGCASQHTKWCQHATKGLLTHSVGSSLLKTGDRAATMRGDRKVKTRASERGKYCRDQYRLETTPKPKLPRRTSSHFLQYQ